MKLRQFSSNTRKGREPQDIAPTISVSRDSSRVYINSATVDILGLGAGDNVNFYEVEDRKGEWYLSKVKRGAQGAFDLEVAKNCRTVLEIVHRGLVNALLQAAKEKKGSTRMPLIPATIDGKGMWKIVTEREIVTE